MPSDFTALIADIEREAQDEGLRAVRELEQFREEFALPVSRIAKACSGDQTMSPGATSAAKRH